MAFSFNRFFILARLAVCLAFCLMANNPAHACYDVRSSHPIQVPPDTELDTSGIDTADVVFVGIVIRDRNSPTPTFRVVAPIKGAQLAEVFHAPSATDCDFHNLGELWLYEFTKPSSSSLEQLRVKALEATGLSWTEDTNPVKYGVYVEAKLRDACGVITSPLKAAQLKNAYHVDISTLKRFEPVALLAKADKGDADAQDELRQYYECQKNEPAALDWRRKAEFSRSIGPAQKGDAHAAAIVGWSYAQGVDGGKKDYIEAARWLKKAVPSGEPLALTTLAHMYLDGNGVDKDPAQGALLLTLLMRQAMGFPQPASLCPGRTSHTFMQFNSTEQLACEQALKTLSPEQLIVVQRQVADWEKAHCDIPNTVFPCRK